MVWGFFGKNFVEYVKNISEKKDFMVRHLTPGTGETLPGPP